MQKVLFKVFFLKHFLKPKDRNIKREISTSNVTVLFWGQNSSHSGDTSFVCPTKSLIARGPPCHKLQSVPIENMK